MSWPAMSPDIDPVRTPALFREFLPIALEEVSRRPRLTGRTVETVMFRSPAELGGCAFAPEETFLFDMEGEGDDVDDVMPFVWMFAGVAFLPFVAALGMATAVAGDIVPGT